MKRKLSIVILVISCLMLTSCDASRVSAKDVLIEEMEAIQSGDFEKIREYMNTDLLLSHPLSTEPQTPEGFDEEELALIFEYISYEIVDVYENPFGATAEIDITNKDMVDVYEEYMDIYLPQTLGEENIYMTAEERDELSRQVLLEVLEWEKNEVTTNVEVTMYYVDGKWIIESSERFNMAIMGGLFLFRPILP